MENKIQIVETGQGQVTLSPAMAENDIKQSEQALMSARGMVVSNDNEYQVCGQMLNNSRLILKDIDSRRKAKVQPFNEVVKFINGYFKIATDNHEKAISIESDLMVEYNKKKEEQARIEQAKLQAEADKKAKELEERAKKAELKGNAEKAEELRQQAQMKAATVPIIETSAPKVAGNTPKRKDWGEIRDFKAYVDYCVKTDNIELLEVNQKELDRRATSYKGTKQIPGVEFKFKIEMKGCRQ